MSINKGRCYATKDFAAGDFNAKDGGVLKFKDRDDIKLVILPDALSGSQRVYMKLMPDPLDGGANFSPVVECGPPGLNFQVSSNKHILSHARAHIDIFQVQGCLLMLTYSILPIDMPSNSLNKVISCLFRF